MNDAPGRRSEKVREIAVTSLFAAVIFLMAFTPIGFIRLPMIEATIIHVPVIIGSVLLGPRIGALLGGLFGLTSFINSTMAPALLGFAFSPLIPVPGLGRGSLWALAVCFVPRILVGVVPYYVDLLLRSFRKNDAKWRYVSLFCAGVSGALTNTLLVMHMIFFVFRDINATFNELSVNIAYGFVLSTIALHGLPEAVVAGFGTAAIVKAVLNIRGRRSAHFGG